MKKEKVFFGLVISWIVIAVFISIGGSYVKLNTKPNKSKSNTKVIAGEEEARRNIRNSIRDGLITHLSYKNHSVRMNPVVWRGLSYDVKHNFMVNLAVFFHVHCGSPKADLLSNQNDTRLAYCDGSKIIIVY